MKNSYIMIASLRSLWVDLSAGICEPYICSAAARLLGVVDPVDGTRFRVTISDRPNGGRSVVFEEDTNFFRIRGHSFAGGCAICDLAKNLKLDTFYVRVKRLG